MTITPPARPPSEEAREMGEALARLRAARGMTQQAAADAFGVTRTAWQNYENGRAVVLRTDMQDRLAKALGGEREDLLHALRQITTGRHSATGPGDSAWILDGPGRKSAVFPLAEGEVVISFPSRLAPESLIQLAEYFALFIRSQQAPPA